VTPTLSILIPTRNAAAYLPDWQRALELQRGAPIYEVIAVDSGSTDGTPELLERAGVGVLKIRPEDFGHGKTRNLGLSACQGDLVLLTVQDALPQGPGFLANLVQPLIEDLRVAAVRARQVPPPGSPAAVRWRVEQAPAFDTRTRRYELAPGEDLPGMPPDQALEFCGLDFVATCIRRDVWKRLALPEAPFAEDRAWAARILGDGLAWVHRPDAVVLHAHDRPVDYSFRRRYLEERGRRDLLGRNGSLASLPVVRALLGSAALARDIAWFLQQSGGPGPAATQMRDAAADLWAGEAGSMLAQIEAALDRPWRYQGTV